MRHGKRLHKDEGYLALPCLQDMEYRTADGTRNNKGLYSWLTGVAGYSIVPFRLAKGRKPAGCSLFSGSDRDGCSRNASQIMAMQGSTAPWGLPPCSFLGSDYRVNAANSVNFSTPAGFHLKD